MYETDTRGWSDQFHVRGKVAEFILKTSGRAEFFSNISLITIN